MRRFSPLFPVFFLLASACGDPLLDGGDPGPPSLVLDLRMVGLDPSQGNRQTSAVLVWTRLSAPLDPFEIQPVALVPQDVSLFELRIFGAPSPDAVDIVDTVEVIESPEQGDPPAVALAFLGVVEGSELTSLGDGPRLKNELRGIAHYHLVLWVHRPELVRATLADTIINPDALTEGMNLVVGLCRPGRSSQLLVVPPERVTMARFDDLVDGTCIDVFWGDWR